MSAPWTFDQARMASEDASAEQDRAEEALRVANAAYAQANEAYRRALALEMWRLRREDGVAWSTISDLARGAEQVIRLKTALIEAEGDREIASHAVYKRGADRREVGGFITWSMRRDLAEDPGGREPERPIVYGQRAAA